MRELGIGRNDANVEAYISGSAEREVEEEGTRVVPQYRSASIQSFGREEGVEEVPKDAKGCV